MARTISSGGRSGPSSTTTTATGGPTRSTLCRLQNHLALKSQQKCRPWMTSVQISNERSTRKHPLWLKYRSHEMFQSPRPKLSAGGTSPFFRPRRTPSKRITRPAMRPNSIDGPPATSNSVNLSRLSDSLLAGRTLRGGQDGTISEDWTAAGTGHGRCQEGPRHRNWHYRRY